MDVYSYLLTGWMAVIIDLVMHHICRLDVRQWQL